MNELVKLTKVVNWLESKLINHESGIIFEADSRTSFDSIQKFIECHDRAFKTVVIYYQAFPEESALEFCETLSDELTSKLGVPAVDRRKSILDLIEDAELKMIVIDDCHFYPQGTLEKLLNLFSACQISLILVGERKQIESMKILDLPLVSQWDKLELN